MKVTLIITTLFLALLQPGCGPSSREAIPPADITSNAHFAAEKGPNHLQEYLKVIEGTWINEGYYLGVEEGQLLKETEADLTIFIDPTKTLNQQALIVVSEYCRPGYIQYLHFELVFDHLEFVGGSADGCFLDMPKIDYMEIRFEVENQDTILIYEAREMEYEHEQVVRLRRSKHHLIEETQWACGLQEYLNSFLREGRFNLYTTSGELISTEEAFGLTAFEEELEYFNVFSYFWPGYEELCLRAETEVVTIGGNWPGSDLQVYAIEWDVDEIRLYLTDFGEVDVDQSYPVTKGELAYTIKPYLPLQQPDL